MDFHEDKRFRTFGTYGGFFPLMCLAWKGMRHVFSIKAHEKGLNEEIPRAEKEIAGLRCSHNLLNKSPVDLLAVDSSNCLTIKDPHRIEHSERMIDRTIPANRPKIIFESWAVRTGSWEYGPAGKSSRVRWQNRGYQTRIQRVDAQNVGGAIVQPRLLVVRIQEPLIWKWREINDSPQKRAMSNLLTPPGLIHLRQRQYYQKVEGRVAESTSAPMPSTPGQWIRTEKGIRRLFTRRSGKRHRDSEGMVNQSGSPHESSFDRKYKRIPLGIPSPMFECKLRSQYEGQQRIKNGRRRNLSNTSSSRGS